MCVSPGNAKGGVPASKKKTFSLLGPFSPSNIQQELGLRCSVAFSLGTTAHLDRHVSIWPSYEDPQLGPLQFILHNAASMAFLNASNLSVNH